LARDAQAQGELSKRDLLHAGKLVSREGFVNGIFE
jgi:hypothetical protein